VRDGRAGGAATVQAEEAVVRPEEANFLTGTYREVESHDLELV